MSGATVICESSLCLDSQLRTDLRSSRSGWSQGPPTSDAIATVQWAHLYFNSTSLSEAAFNSDCAAAGRPAPCNV
ncbi:hypothetical protein L218DRAFT_690223 [Marasmius fiardii PR-910]|nr:hypothetical protein L218DRAFT_690223 [Marasmius fiardii PR-910]